MNKRYEHLKKDAEQWPDNAIYFLTDSTFLHFPFFNTDEKKDIIYNQFKKISNKFGVPISDYSIAINHFHIKFYLDSGKTLGKIKQILRGGISYELRKNFDIPYKEIWQSRKVFIVYNEESNWRVSGYIIGNLLKHKEVSTFGELRDNKYSSYWYIAKKYGEDTAKSMVYSVINTDEDSFGGVDIESLSV